MTTMANEVDERSLEEIIPPEGIKTPQVEADVMDLERAHNLISSSSTPAVEAAKIEDPINRVTLAVANYIDHLTSLQVEHRKGFSAIIEDAIIAEVKAGHVKIDQLLGLYGTDRVTSTDEMSKMLGPMSSTINTAQQAKIAEENRMRALAEKGTATGGVQVNIGNVGATPAAAKAANEIASKEVLQGLTMFSQILEAQKKNTGQPNLTDEDIAEAQSNKVSDKDM
jgi:hypothetical protein